ncbi:MAG: hypothetical protein JW861_08920 [Bacteroidales bacterium]|nr:hypothetical protein [Bacteroidales bacterium]
MQTTEPDHRSCTHAFMMLLVMLCVNASGQQGERVRLSVRDSILMSHIPVIDVPLHYLGGSGPPLPPELNNAELPWFPPIFAQDGWSCGQASGVGYNFTYEINASRETPADTSLHWYSPHYTWNFYNEGEFDLGVSYYHSFDVIRWNGHPSVSDFGAGISHLSWLDGYMGYLRGMHNRIRGVYAIPVGTPLGLNILKYWLLDHLGGSAAGGVASFYSEIENVTLLTDSTPEGGSNVVTRWSPYNGHAMTIVGYNDSIRYDYNEDGLFTNHLDINGDGQTDMRDWEIGGLLFANSYGNTWADSGFCYMMYKTLAEDKPHGGIWNRSVHVLEVDEDYRPMIAFKVTLTHSARNLIRIRAGISGDTSILRPEYTMDFPVFDFQGGDHYMTGTDTSLLSQTLELGLDVTPLLGHALPGTPARFFLMVDERDPSNSSSGILNAFTLMDYTATADSVICSGLPVNLAENLTTALSVVHTASHEKVTILDEEIPPFVPGEPYIHQFTGSGGSPPYTWSLTKKYRETHFLDNYPQINGEQVFAATVEEGMVTLALPFSFPFYGIRHDSVTLHSDGFLIFRRMSYPLPYQMDDDILMSIEPAIAPFLSQDMQAVYGYGDGIWYEGDASQAAFRWKMTLEEDTGPEQVDFTLILESDGGIRMHYNQEFTVAQEGIAGISAGDGRNRQTGEIPWEWKPLPGFTVQFIPDDFPVSASIDENGILTAYTEDEYRISRISVTASDRYRVPEEKNFQWSSGIRYRFDVHSGDDHIIEYGETVTVDLHISNTGSQILDLDTFLIHTEDTYVDVPDGHELLTGLMPGEEKTFEGAFEFDVSPQVPDRYDLRLECSVIGETGTWQGSWTNSVYSPVFGLDAVQVEDGNNHHLDPGEQAVMKLKIRNEGGADAEDVECTLTPGSGFITVGGNPVASGLLESGQSLSIGFPIGVSPSAPGDHVVFTLKITSAPGITEELTFDMLVGRIPVAIVDFDPAKRSGPVMDSLFTVLDIPHRYSTNIPDHPEDYMSLFVCLGRKFEQYILSGFQGDALKAYLQLGGNLYMEGGLTWYEDPQTAVHPMFHAEPVYINWHQYDTVRGHPGSWASDLKYIFRGEMPYYNYFLSAGENAYHILYADSLTRGCVTAYSGEGYRTLASTVDFSGLVNDTCPAMSDTLLMRYLKFFGYVPVHLQVDEISIPPEEPLCNAYPNPASGHVSFEVWVPGPTSLQISIFGHEGRLIRQVAESTVTSRGASRFTWDGRSNSGSVVPPGLYIAVIRTAGWNHAEKIIIR